MATSVKTKGFSTIDLGRVWREAAERSRVGEFARLAPAALARNWGPRFSADEIGAVVIPKRTLARRIAKRELLTVEETDRALRLARVSGEADRVFGDLDKSGRWLRKSNRALAGQTPLDLLRTEAGGRAVEELLGQIDHGMFV